MKIFISLSVFLYLCCSMAFLNADSSSKLADQEVSKRTTQHRNNRKKHKTVIIRYDPSKEKHYSLIPLRSLSYDNVDKICRPMLSEGGILVYEKRRNAILVYDTEKVIKKIKRFLRKIDYEPVNIRIEIDYLDSGRSLDSGFGVYTDYGMRYTKPKVIIVNGKRQTSGRILVKMPGLKRVKQVRNTTQFITTLSGHPASLVVGKKIVDPSWLRHYTLRPSIYITNKSVPIIVFEADDLQWNFVGASLKLLPKYFSDDTIEVSFFPVVSYIDGEGKNQTVYVQSLESKVRVKNGQRIYVGGVLKHNKRKYLRLFGRNFFKTSDGHDILNMYLTARVIKNRSRKK